MLKAILHKKVRGWEQAAAGDAFGYEGTEDFLTASVFGRVAYLPGGLAWELLSGALVPAPELPQPPGGLIATSFWPSCTVGDPQVDRTRIEPDLWLEFENLFVIVEAKRRDGVDQQRPEQLAWNWWATVQHHGSDKAKQFLLLAVGGMRSTTREQAESLACDASAFLETIDPACSAVRLAVTSWKRLLAGVRRLVDEEHPPAVDRLLEDMTMAFRIHGFVQTRWLDDLQPRESIHESSIATFRRMSWEDRARRIGRIDPGAISRLSAGRGRR